MHVCGLWKAVAHGDQNLATVNEYQTVGLEGMNGDVSDGEERDATATIYQMHRKLLYMLSCTELFHKALEWQDLLDRRIDHAGGCGSSDNKDVSGLTATFETEFEDDSTFQGLQENTKATQDETFEFHPNNDTNQNQRKIHQHHLTQMHQNKKSSPSYIKYSHPTPR